MRLSVKTYIPAMGIGAWAGCRTDNADPAFVIPQLFFGELNAHPWTGSWWIEGFEAVLWGAIP